jgi:hypothetical protein
MINDRGKIKCSGGGGVDENLMQNVTLRRVRVTNVVVENQYVLHILSVCL